MINIFVVRLTGGLEKVSYVQLADVDEYRR
jgi:hypothetical protein